MSPRYVHALTSTAVPAFTIEGGTIDAIDVGGIFAITEAMLHAPGVSEEALRRQHAVVVEVFARTDAVLPARFGSFLEIEELRRLVELRRDTIQRALDLVRGREQMTVRIMGGTQPPPPPAAADTPPTTGTAYLNERRARASGRGLPGVDAVQRAVKDLVAADRVEPGPVFATVYHLIASGGSARYRARLAEIASAVAPLVLRVSGPWPPFAFVPDLIA
jgi:hypothetical protein